MLALIPALPPTTPAVVRMNGSVATAIIRSHEALTGAPAVPVIAVTANSLPEDRRRFAACRMDGLIVKPVKLGALLPALHDFLAARGLEPGAAAAAERGGSAAPPAVCWAEAAAEGGAPLLRRLSDGESEARLAAARHLGLVEVWPPHRREPAAPAAGGAA